MPRRLAASLRRSRRAREDDSYRPDLAPGELPYRGYVGPAGDYDLIGGLQFTLLFAAGLRETHTLLDVGCGSLRGGRLFIPYLLPGRYVGVEPNEWLVEEGIRNELGRSVVAVKRPRFLSSSTFDFSAAGTSFDFVLAQSILSHTYPDLARRLFEGAADVLAAGGALLATYVEGDGPAAGSGWVYPGIVEYGFAEVRAMASASGLAAAPLAWPHPRQRWFVATRSEEASSAIAERVAAPAVLAAGPGAPDR